MDDEEQKIITVGKLIEILEKYPKDKIITYDYVLPIEIFELENGNLTIA